MKNINEHIVICIKCMIINNKLLKNLKKIKKIENLG